MLVVELNKHSTHTVSKACYIVVVECATATDHIEYHMLHHVLTA
jgi:hypothetical protein